MQYNIFFIPNLFIKLISLNILSNIQNVVNSINKLSNGISFIANITGNQEIQVYSDKMPIRVLKNGAVLQNVSSYSLLTANKWFYDSSEKKLYMIVNPIVTPTTTVSTTTISVTTTTVIATTTTTISGTTTTTTPGTEKTFGNTIIGSTFTGMGNSIFGSKYKLTETAQVSKISAYLHTATGSDASAAIYSDFSGSPDVLQASSSPIPLSSWSWHDFTLSATLSPGDYWLVIKCNSCYFRNSIGENNQWASRWDGSGSFPTKFGSVVSWNNWNITIFATYTI